MIVFNRKIVNLNIFSFSFLAIFNLFKFNTIFEDIQIRGLRDKTIIFSMNLLKKLFILFKVFSIIYLACMEVQSDNSN